MRRANGEGNVIHRSDGRWQARYYVDDGGRYRRVYLYGKTRQEVAKRLREALTARDGGVLPPRGRESMAAYLRTWLEGARPTVRPRTWERYEEHVRLHLSPTLGRVPLSRLTPAHVQRAYADLLARGLSPGTVRRAHATLHRALAQALQWRLVGSNVATLISAPRQERREMKTLTEAKARRLLDIVAGDRDEALYVLAVTAGIRQGELLALRWSDVDLDTGTVRVVGALSREPDAGLVVAETKTAKSRRRVELTPTAIEALRRHRLAQTETRLRAGDRWLDRDLVCASPTGGYLHAADVLRRFHAALRRAGLPMVRFHDLRHTAATLMLGRGIHPKIVSEMLGHSTIAITLDLYSHVTETMQRGAAQTMDEVFRRPS